MWVVQQAQRVLRQRLTSKVKSSFQIKFTARLTNHRWSTVQMPGFCIFNELTPGSDRLRNPPAQSPNVIGKCYQLFSPRDYRPDQLQYILSPAIVTPVGNWYRILRNQTDGLCHSLENHIIASRFLADWQSQHLPITVRFGKMAASEYILGCRSLIGCSQERRFPKRK